MNDNNLYWHFTGNKLRNGDPIPPIGEWIAVQGKLVPCEWGLHASKHPFDALSFAPGPILHLVELGGEIIAHNTDKVVSRKRKIIASFDITDLLLEFARKQALTVIDSWDAPSVVIEYLKTGNVTARSAAESAAWSAAGSAAWSAARSAARSAAESAAWSAAWSAAESAAESAAWSAAGSAARLAARSMFEKMVNQKFNLGE